MKRGRLTLLLVLSCSPPLFAQAPVEYRVTFPAPEHHVMEVEVVFADAPPGSLHVHMSRSSPGRYAIHEFAKNVYDVRIDDGVGSAVRVTQPNASEWDVADHRGRVRVRYRVFGDRVDGTFLGVDTNHAHINIPAALMWASELEGRPVRVTFVPPSGSGWNIATQLHPTTDPLTFTAGNLQYLIDSPAELSRFALRTFELDGHRFRIALHHDGTDMEADAFARDVARIVKEEEAVFGEFPEYEPGGYTFLADFLPYVIGDGMEHRNSTVMTSTGALRDAAERADILGTVSHEFFHNWNIERIRPRSLEPFDLADANMASELWLGEGFNEYYGHLVLQRAGFASLPETAAKWGADIDVIVRSPARKYRSVEDMSRMAPFVDVAAITDRTNLDNTFISYYTWGEAIALALDLSLRERSGGAITLDDYMRALWVKFGKPSGAAEGLVARPYTTADARECLAEVAGDSAFADEFFARYVQGREVADYAALLARAGLLLRQRNAGRAWIGALQFRSIRGSLHIARPTIEDTPAFAAGLDRDDELLLLDGEGVDAASRVDEILRRHKPGDQIKARIRRRGVVSDVTMTTVEDPTLELVPLDAPSPAQRALRAAWLH